MDNIIIHNELCESEIYKFDNVIELSIFLNREMESVQNSLYKIEKGIRKSKKIKNYEGVSYIVDYMTYESIFRYKRNNVVYNVLIYDKDDNVKTFSNFRDVVHYLEEIRNNVSMEIEGKRIIEVEMKNIM